MSISTQSFFIRSGRMKKLLSSLGQLKSHADSTGNSELISQLATLQNLFTGAEYYVGIPDESYPTLYSGKDLNLETVDDMVTIRVETKAGSLAETIANLGPVVKKLKDSEDHMAGTADLVLTILEVMKQEEYRGKTHQVASFDPLGERLGFYP